jgi:hypothetical protein
MRAILVLPLLAMAACQSERDILIEAAKTSAADKLRDPSSAQFKDVDLCKTPGMVVGQINGKNSFGAYAGFEVFIYKKPLAHLSSEYKTDLDGDGSSGAMIDLINECYAESPKK